MKGLNLNAYGVRKMVVAEMQQTNGGSGFRVEVLAWALGCFLWDTISNPRETANAMNKGAMAACEIEI